jgi:hypothetical protein
MVTLFRPTQQLYTFIYHIMRLDPDPKLTESNQNSEFGLDPVESNQKHGLDSRWD